jgi:hypothetical protein
MLKAILITILLGGMACADEASDRTTVARTVTALADSSVRADQKKMAELLMSDFDGDLVVLPERRPWCELSCPGLSIRSVRFITADVALVDITATGDGVTAPDWVMVMKKDGAAWRIAASRPAFARRLPLAKL